MSVVRPVEIKIELEGDAKTGHRGFLADYLYDGEAPKRLRVYIVEGQSLWDGLSAVLKAVDDDIGGHTGRRAPKRQQQLDLDAPAAGAAA